MKKFIVLILSLILSLCFCLTGCAQTVWGENPANGSGEKPNGSGNNNGGTDGDIPDGAYTVTLVLPEEVSKVGGDTIDYSGISAQWSNSTSVFTADFNSDGLAYMGGLDGEYTVTILGDIKGEKFSYTYNPNIYEASGTAAGRNVKIQLLRLMSFSGGNGSSHYDGVRAVAKYAGAYRIEFTRKDQSFYFEFNPTLTTTGYIYTLETLLSVVENEVNPTLSVLLYSTRNVTDVITGGSEYSGSFTKNIKMTIYKATATSGGAGSDIYKIDIDCINGDYPKYVDIYIAQSGEYSNDDFWNQYGYFPAELEDYDREWKEKYYGGNDPEGTFVWLSDLCENKDFTNCGEVKLENGYYYIEYNGEWHMVFAELASCHYYIINENGQLEPLYDFTPNINGKSTSLCQSTRVYYDFVIQAYLETVTAQGYHPVSEQLKTFLHDYSAMTFYYDGQIMYGAMLEQLGYSSNDKNMWLFACGIYL